MAEKKKDGVASLGFHRCYSFFSGWLPSTLELGMHTTKMYASTLGGHTLVTAPLAAPASMMQRTRRPVGHRHAPHLWLICTRACDYGSGSGVARPLDRSHADRPRYMHWLP